MNKTGNKGIRTDSCEIVMQALEFKPPRRLPVAENCCMPEWEAIWRKTRNIPVSISFEDHFGKDLAVHVADETFWPTQQKQIEKSGDYVLLNDGWGRVIRTRPGTYFSETVERSFGKPSDLDSFTFDSARLDSRYLGLVAAVEQDRKKHRAVFIKVGGVFIRSSFFRGETEFLMDLAQDISCASSIAAKVGRHLTEIGLESMRRTQTYDTGVWIYDDMCNVNSPMFSPAVFEKVFLPIYKNMISAFKSAGARRVILHCDGNMLPLIDLLIEAGFDGCNPVERNAGMLVEELVARYHGKFSFIGGLCNTQILPRADINEIRRHIEAVVDSGRNGGLVIGTHSIGPDIPVEIFELYRDIVAQCGAYRS